jgi:hypothetical protein
MEKRSIDIFVPMYKRGMVVNYNGYEYEIDHTVICDGELYVVFTGSANRVNTREVYVPPTHFIINATTN